MCATLLKALSKMHCKMCSRVHSKIFVTFASLKRIFNDILQQCENSKHLQITTTNGNLWVWFCANVLMINDITNTRRTNSHYIDRVMIPS